MNDSGFTTNDPFKQYKIAEIVYGTPVYITTEERKQLTTTIDTDAIKQLQFRILQLEQTQTKADETQQERGRSSGSFYSVLLRRYPAGDWPMVLEKIREK